MQGGVIVDDMDGATVRRRSRTPTFQLHRVSLYRSKHALDRHVLIFRTQMFHALTIENQVGHTDT